MRLSEKTLLLLISVRNPGSGPGQDHVLYPDLFIIPNFNLIEFYLLSKCRFNSALILQTNCYF